MNLTRIINNRFNLFPILFLAIIFFAGILWAAWSMAWSPRGGPNNIIASVAVCLRPLVMGHSFFFRVKTSRIPHWWVKSHGRLSRCRPAGLDLGFRSLGGSVLIGVLVPSDFFLCLCSRSCLWSVYTIPRLPQSVPLSKSLRRASAVSMLCLRK